MVSMLSCDMQNDRPCFQACLLSLAMHFVVVCSDLFLLRCHGSIQCHGAIDSKGYAFASTLLSCAAAGPPYSALFPLSRKTVLEGVLPLL